MIRTVQQRFAKFLHFAAVGPELPESLREARFALVSTILPPVREGWPIMLETLLESIPEDQLVTFGGPRAAWGSRHHVTIPYTRFGPSDNRSKRAGYAIANAVVRARGRALSRTVARRSGLRRVLATLDPMLPFARELALQSGAELWVYGIDDHTSGLERGEVTELLRAATRFDCLSPELGEAMRQKFGVGATGVLPPLTDVPLDAPAWGDTGVKTLLFCGSVMPYHREHFYALAEHAPPHLELVVVTESTHWENLPWKRPERWIVRGGRDALDAALRGPTVGMVLLPTTPDLEFTVAFPTKLRDYLARGRPVLAVAAASSCTSRVVSGGLGWVASALEQLPSRLAEIGRANVETLAAMSAATHRFARETVDRRTVGGAWLERFCG